MRGGYSLAIVASAALAQVMERLHHEPALSREDDSTRRADMDDELLARDGYSERPPLLRVLALLLVALLLILFGGPRQVLGLLAFAAGVDYLRYLRRRRQHLAPPSRQLG